MKRPILLVAVCVFLAGCDLLKSGEEPTPLPANEMHYEALGASDTIGIGSSQPCLPFVSCTAGPGYVQRVTRRFQSDGKTVTLNNLGVPGAVLSPEVQTLGNSLGLDIFRNLLNDEAPYVRRTSTLVTIFIGANDANTIGRAMIAGAGGTGGNLAVFAQSNIDRFARDMKTVVTTVRGRSASVRIVALNLPNMAAAPYAAGFTLDQKRFLQNISVGLSAGVNALASDGVIVIDLMCDTSFYNPALFSGDGFHPNDTGYGYLADLVYAAANTGTTAAPRASCAPMTIF
jgi:lysophospholipase L1-like esterase